MRIALHSSIVLRRTAARGRLQKCLAYRLSPVFAPRRTDDLAGVRGRPARRYRLPDQAADRAQPASCRPCELNRSRRRVGRCRIWNDTDFRDASPKSAWLTPSASSPPPACGCPTCSLCLPSRRADAVVQRPPSGAMVCVGRSRPINWRSNFPKRPDGAWLGAEAPTPNSPGASPRCGFAPPIAIMNVRRRAPRNGV